VVAYFGIVAFRQQSQTSGEGLHAMWLLILGFLPSGHGAKQQLKAFSHRLALWPEGKKNKISNL
jgi:hypothetical protein